MYPGKWASEAPDRPAAVLTETGEELTYAQLEERSAKLAHWFREQGLQRGDVVALLATNSLEHFEIYWAVMRSGLYLTPINFHLLPSEVSYILDDSDAQVLIASADLGDLAKEALAAAPKVRKALAYGGQIDGFEDYVAAYAGQPSGDLDDDRAGRAMLYSSGTTGKPKGVRQPLPEESVKSDGDGALNVVAPIFGFGDQTRYLSPAPLYHAAPLRYSGQIQVWGGTVYVMPRFDAEDALRQIDRYQITHSQWVPTMFVRMLKLPEQTRGEYDVSSMQVAIHAAAPCPQDVKRAMIDWWGPVLWEYYAGSEGNGTTIINSEQWLTKPGSVGKPATTVVHICDDEGNELPVGEIGKVYFESERPPFEYYKSPEKTASSRHPRHEKWTAIGDLGYVDEDGFLFLAERQSFVIISGGVNIYPQEIEDALTMHPSVGDVAVIGVDDADLGEVVKAVVELVDGVPANDDTREALMEHLRERVAKYKLPRTIDFTERLPRTPTGKLRKHQLRAQYQ
ncbi:AMP-binding protein [Epidermidibacterium keratini]|uniref:AMP-binding protein n=1 Tax=Epidermidibacterium keratini TaxID=1891644 RepID=A0A7L4YPK9_9ACTN|nr:acyl-CoA synthetase [Epidermidibacterium keratini]QHC01086.1 AMP-binding protein [Epidermidibacterium keratini]